MSFQCRYQQMDPFSSVVYCVVCNLNLLYRVIMGWQGHYILPRRKSTRFIQSLNFLLHQLLFYLVHCWLILRSIAAKLPPQLPPSTFWRFGGYAEEHASSLRGDIYPVHSQAIVPANYSILSLLIVKEFSKKLSVTGINRDKKILAESTFWPICHKFRLLPQTLPQAIFMYYMKIYFGVIYFLLNFSNS